MENKIYLIIQCNKIDFKKLIKKQINPRIIEMFTEIQILFATKNKSEAIYNCRLFNRRDKINNYYFKEIDLL